MGNLLHVSTYYKTESNTQFSQKTFVSIRMCPRKCRFMYSCCGCPVCHFGVVDVLQYRGVGEGVAGAKINVWLGVRPYSQGKFTLRMMGRYFIGGWYRCEPDPVPEHVHQLRLGRCSTSQCCGEKLFPVG